ncbi:hypothetical protein M409DRAFT_63940 [Zasmidium cellare ATCC 36951]|uniref:Uncharacterized protein n=1 Tax=Zasmidium cellare ATCC 36951 TaxID=1080233 RepID=A0A6A6CV42_ZASCE|nr:uncharacterized protein M409DRAFT_63940 [Zasmidium cellare ATCC 36951]KAF2170915.1 hypothetical protein M409DRAFT_63940 [Zasmidium cellare ATCC 36951]
MSHGSIKPHWKPFITTTIINTPPTTDKKKPPQSKRPWLPLTLRKPYLLALILTTLVLIVIVQYLLYVSRRDQGIIFAEDINELPLRRAFCYLYLPTIVSVVYGFLWTWVDLDVKRLEPWFQVSREGGATGRLSVLLNYPLEFLVNVPFIAFKNRHWHVLSASTIMMLVLWGITPLQAGIFAVRTVTAVEDISSGYSSSYTPVDQQPDLFGEYAQFVSNIAWLNETLPPFMTRDFVLAEFGSSSDEERIDGRNAILTGETYLYSLDISCEEPVRWEKQAGIVWYNTSRGCSFYGPTYRPMGGNDTSKPFDTMYVGYSNQDGKADYYLSNYCNELFEHSFFVRLTKSSPAAIFNGTFDDLKQIQETSLFCEPTYYKQKAHNASISLPSKAVLGVGALGERETLPLNMVNTTAFEWQMSAGTGGDARIDFPTSNFPDQKAYLVNIPLNLAYISKMAPFAIATTQLPLESYLDHETLRLSYQAAYRLLFARHLTEILGSDLDTSSDQFARRSYVTQAVVVIPGFAYAATAILALIAVLAIGIFATITRRPNKLTGDVATLRSLMDFSAHDPALIKTFSHLDDADSTKIDKALQDTHLYLEYNDECREGPLLRIRNSEDEVGLEAMPLTGTTLSQSSEDDNEPTSKGPGVRPIEMKLGIGAVFLSLQIAAIITFTVLYFKARQQNGLALPSNSTFVRQLLENYIPIALATLIEPFWLLLNKMYCLLLPYEQLRKGNAPGRRSVNLDYSSLPPQFLFWKAVRARHFVLMVVCLMVLAANVLAVALGGLMNEATRSIVTSSTFTPVRDAKFKELNGTGLPFNSKTSNTFQGGTTSDQFYRDMSNLTANTPLPPWTDSTTVYLPLNTESSLVNTSFQFKTTALGVELDCQTLNEESYSIRFSNDASEANLTVPLNNGDGIVNCTDFRVGQQPLPQDTTPDDRPGLSYLSDYQPGHVALEMATMLQERNGKHDLFCRQHYVAGWMRADLEYVGDRFDLTDLGLRKMKIVSRNETMILCKPKMNIGPAEIVVDSRCQVQRSISANLSSGDIDTYFSSSPQDLIAQANQFLTNNGATWHNDSFPSDYINYLIKKSTNDTTLLDPSLPPPDASHAMNRLSPLYTTLFAILLGSNLDLLLSNTARPQSIIPGSTITPETRIVFSTPAFIVVEAILLCYIITTIFFYARRPWKVLPRLPSTVASNIAFFAGSHVLREIGEGGRGREWTWAYGTFAGSDGRTHTGIEREPFVAVLRGEVLPGGRRRR